MKDTRVAKGVGALKELAAFARQTWLMPQTGRALREHGRSDHLVVFIHGYFATSGVLGPMAGHLKRRALAPRQLHFNYPSTGSIARHALALRAAIEEAHPRGPVCVVGHSLGGLIARYYAQVLGGRLDALVTLATPHRGTKSARGWPLTLARELSPGSATLQHLEATRARLRPVKLASLVALNDLLVSPESAALEGSRIERFEGVGHHGLLFDERGWAVAEETLDLVQRRVRVAASEGDDLEVAEAEAPREELAWRAERAARRMARAG